MKNTKFANAPKGSSLSMGEGRGGAVARGLRNNNPLNIRRDGQAWQGLRDEQKDKAFCQFKSMAYGFRAAFITIHTYMAKHGLCSIRQIVSRWAPLKDHNNTDAYIAVVCELTHLGMNDMLWWSNESQMLALVQAMAYVENGVLMGTNGSMKDGYLMAAESIRLRQKLERQKAG